MFVQLVRYTYAVGYENYIRENVLFVSLEQYKKGLIKFDEMRFENYEMVFELYLIICLFTLAVFVYGQLRNRLHSKFHFAYRYKIKRFRRNFRKSLIRNMRMNFKKLRQAKMNLLKPKIVKPKVQKFSIKKIKIHFLQPKYRIHREV